MTIFNLLNIGNRNLAIVIGVLAEQKTHMIIYGKTPTLHAYIGGIAGLIVHDTIYYLLKIY